MKRIPNPAGINAVGCELPVETKPITAIRMRRTPNPIVNFAMN
jgi:hypothetical protein